MKRTTVKASKGFTAEERAEKIAALVKKAVR
jgi:hypothetical protein